MATRAQITNFINTLGKLAVNECKQRIAAGQGFILPSVCIAQASLESGWGTAQLMVTANAYFGIKAGSSWTGKRWSSLTNEVYDGQTVTVSATWRAYDSPAESVADYYNLICTLSRYAAAVSTADNVKTPADTISGIYNGGYATDPDYVSKILGIIKSYDLTEWDKMPGGDLTNYRTKIVEIAAGEVGAAEPSGDDKYISFYNKTVGVNYAMNTAWCAIFVTYCARQAGIPATVIPNFAWVPSGAQFFQNAGAWKLPDVDPEPGDLIFFWNDNTGRASHVGIVEAVDADRVYTIEGNTSDSVKRRSYARHEVSIYGYGTYAGGYGSYGTSGVTKDGYYENPFVIGTAAYKECELAEIMPVTIPAGELAELVEIQ